jgi:hypothetical protein
MRGTSTAATAVEPVGAAITGRRHNVAMSLATGIIRDGQLVLEGEQEPLPEGRRFTMLIEGDEPVFELTPDQVKLLLESQAKIRRGEFFTTKQILEDLDDE